MKPVCLIIGIGCFGDILIEKYINQGYKVLVTYRSFSKIERLIKKFGGVDFIQCDLTSPKSIDSLLKNCSNKYSNWVRIIFNARASVGNETLCFDTLQNALSVSTVSLVYIFKIIEKTWKPSPYAIFIVTSGDYATKLNKNRICLSLEKSSQKDVVELYSELVEFKIILAIINGQAMVNTKKKEILNLFL